MSRNGSGTYSLPAGNPVVTGTTISSTWANNTLSDIATALTASIANDGQTVPTANLPMGGFKHTGVATASATTDYARADQVQSSSFQHLTGTAGTNTITASATPTPSAYAAGQRFTLIPANTNTGATTLDVSSLGAKNVFWNGVACVGGEIRQNVPILVFYDGTQFHLLGNSFNAPFNDAYPVVEGSADSTKKVRFEADGLTTATTRVVTVPDRDVTINSLTSITASLGADVSLNNTGSYFDGPSVAQGTSGTWFVSGYVTLVDTAGAATMNVKLWDGTTVVASSSINLISANTRQCVALSGVITSPAGNLRISVNDATSTSGIIRFNSSANSKDSTITAARIG